MLYYMNEITGELTENHKEAMQWFNMGANVELEKVDPNTGELVKCAEWVW